MHPDVVPALAEFWAPEEQTVENLEQQVQGEPTFAHSRKAKHPFGVIYNGSWETLHDGVCIAVRRNACALRRAGVPVFLSSFTHSHWNRGYVEKSFHHELPPEVLSEVGHLTETEHEYTIARILHFVPTNGFLLQQNRPRMGSPQAHAILLSRTIAYMALEMDVFPALWIDTFNSFGGILVPCTGNAEDLRKAGVDVPISVVPHPMALKDPIRKIKIKSTHEGGTVRLLHVGKWEPRKNQHVLIGAFLRAFTPNSGVSLTIHSKPFWGVATYPCEPGVSIAYWLQDEKVQASGWNKDNINLSLKINWNITLSRRSLCDLYSDKHVYVSSGRAEGFDLPAFDAKVVGLRMVYASEKGPPDFCTPGDVRVAADLRSAPPPQYNMPEGTMWRSPDVGEYADALREAVRRVREEPSDSPLDTTRFKIDAVGQVLKREVVRLAEAHNIEIPGLK